MASLKEVKSRINSVKSTRKITSAMKMVASAKLHKAQEAIENMLPYESRLHRILTSFLNAELSIESPFVVKRDVKKVAIVVFASNSSLCGGFNLNIIRHLSEVVEEYSKTIGIENILVYPIGRKVADAVKKMKITPMGDYQHMSGKPNYNEASDLAGELIERYINDEIQEVVLLYNQFFHQGAFGGHDVHYINSLFPILQFQHVFGSLQILFTQDFFPVHVIDVKVCERCRNGGNTAFVFGRVRV